MNSEKKIALFISCFEEWYGKRLEPIIQYYKSVNYEVVCAVSDYNHIKKIYSKKNNSNCTYVHVPGYNSNISLQRIISHMTFGKKIKELIDYYKPQFVYLVLPPNNTARYCYSYKKRHPEVVFVLDIIDLWPESMPIGLIKRIPLLKIWSGWRDRAINIADHIFTECDLYQEKLNLKSQNVSTLYLFKDQSDEEKKLVGEIINLFENDKLDNIKFAYLGSMNNILDIDGICRVVKTFINNGFSCEVHAIGDGEKKAEFENSLKGIGCKTFFYGCIFNEVDKIRLLAPCHYAFNMMKGEVSVGLTIKSIDYLSYGLPLINNIDGDTSLLVEKYGIGINIKDFTTLTDDIFTINHCAVSDFYLNHLTKEIYIKKVRKVLEDWKI